MQKSLDIFYQLPCLTESSAKLSSATIHKKWFRTADKRLMGQYLQKFVSYNRQLFEFLGVTPYITGSDQNVEIGFQSNHYIGAIPLRAADTGKQIGDFMVVPRFMGKDVFEEYIDIINLLEGDISIEFLHSLPLASGKNFRPPLYLEAVKFVHALEVLVKQPWQKFSNEEKIKNEPTGQINWNKYLHNEYKVENRLKYPVRQNFLSEYHAEFGQIRFAFDICEATLNSSNTPIKIKSALKSKIAFLKHKLNGHVPLKTNSIKINHSDRSSVKDCKIIANKILQHQLTSTVAWRVNFNDVFEKFVQHIFKKFAKTSGSQFFPNFKFQSKCSTVFSWGLKQLEPDAILKSNKIDVFIDAKYKSHLYNKFELNEKLKDEHRRDIHQILAYNSFSTSTLKYGFLCYPSLKVECNQITYSNALNNSRNKVFILGIPLSKFALHQVNKILGEVLNDVIGIVK